MESLVINSLVILACASFFAWRGHEHGVIHNIKGFVSTIAAYLASYFLSAPVAHLLTQYAGWGEIPAYLVAALVLFVGVSFLVRFSLQLLLDKLEEHDVEPSRLAGAAAGIVMGFLLGILLVWTGNIFYDAIQLRTQNSAMLEARKLDPVRQLAGNLVGDAVGYAVQHKSGDDQLAPAVTANLISDPVGMSHKIIAISRSASVKTFFTDTTIQKLMQQNRFDDIARQPLFIAMMNEPVNKEVFTTLSMSIKEPSGLTPEQRTVRLVTDMWQKSQRLVNDPRFMALTSKPEYRALMANPSAPALLASPVMGELASIIFSDAPVPPAPASVEAVTESAPLDAPGIIEAPAASTELEPGPTIYRWKDKAGRIHFSESRPEGDYEVETTTLQH